MATSRWVDVDFAHDVVVPALARTRQHAPRHAAASVDLILAQGTDVGGHAGEIKTIVLVPEGVDLDGARPLGPVRVC